MKIQVEIAGEKHELECFDNKLSPLIGGVILRGITYPVLDVVRQVAVVVDIGANVGASALWFSVMYPDAIVHAFEPGSEPFRLLTRIPRVDRTYVATHSVFFRRMPRSRCMRATTTACRPR